MKLLVTLFLIAIAILFVACEGGPTKSSGTQPQSDIAYFKVGQSRPLGYGNYQIGFDSVLIDDRCAIGSPSDCFYGHALTRFWLHQPNSDTIWLDLDINTGDSLWGSGSLTSVDTAGILVTLASLDPHPRWGQTHKYSEYTAGLLLTDDFADDSSGARLFATYMSNQFMRLDDYDLDSAWIDSDSLTVQVRHGGGCRAHYYQLFMNPDSLAQSSPLQADLYLRHYNNADACLAYLLKRPVFDIDAIKVAYFLMDDGLDSGSVRLNIHGYTDEPDDQFQLMYHFSR